MAEQHPIVHGVRFKNRVGERHHDLLVVGPEEKVNGRWSWWCVCDCGDRALVNGADLGTGQTKSCGCRKHRKRIPDGLYQCPEYRVWATMKARCTNPKDRKFHLYGGRGIVVCERWQDFLNFYADMGPRPSDKQSIDRIDGNGNYEPGNCRWATILEQNRNLRNCIYLTLDGRTQHISEWAAEVGLSRGAIRSRIRTLGWSVRAALYTPHRQEFSTRRIRPRGDELQNT